MLQLQGCPAILLSVAAMCPKCVKRPLRHLYPDVLACCDVSCAFRLHHNCADVINQDSWPLNHVARLQCVQEICRSCLPPSNLHAGCMLETWLRIPCISGCHDRQMSAEQLKSLKNLGTIARQTYNGRVLQAYKAAGWVLGCLHAFPT